MVAVAGKGWGLARSLVAMFDEADKRWPKRSRASDGSIGDAAHAARKSDHNPDASGDVLAGDLTDDKDAGCDADLFAEHLRRSRDPRVKYVICNGRVFRSYGSSAWEWTPYTGANGHFAHTHVSILDTAAAKNDLSPWFPYADAPIKPLPADPPEEDDMPAPANVRDSTGRRWVFARGTDGRLFYKIDDGDFTAADFPANQPGHMGSGPSAFSNGNGTIEITYTESDGDIVLVLWNTAVFDGPYALGGKS